MTQDEGEWRGKLGGMTQEEMEAFLQKGLAMYLACVKPDGSPHCTVVWHEWQDDSFWLVVRARAKWVEYIKANPQVAFVINIPTTLEKVEGHGRAEIVEEPNVGGEWTSVCTSMAMRYLGENGPEYLKPTLQQPRWLIRIRPERLTTWQGVGWARRYWVEDTGGPSYDEAHALA